MKDSLEKGRKAFPTLVREVEKYVEGVHELNPGASDQIIRFGEETLGCKFPKDYREFLKLWNGAILFRGGVMVYGIHKGKQVKDEFPVEDLISVNEPGKRWPSMPESYLKIARTGFGDQFCIDTAAKSGVGQIIQWAHDVGRPAHKYKNFRAWLDNQMKQGHGVIDYEGNIVDE